MDLFGELRAAIEATRGDIKNFPWVAWCLGMIEGERQRAAIDKVRAELATIDSNHASLDDWAVWIARGADGLVEVLEEEASWLESPRAAASQWLAAWAWQCAINEHADLSLAGLHVCMGLGGDRILTMQWDTSIEPAPRHVVVASGQLRTGQFNVHAALQGYPGLPEHLAEFAEVV